jgi:hypothetical protein
VPPHAPHVPAVLDAVSRPEQTNPEAQVPLLPVPQHDCAEPPHVAQMLPEDFSTHDPEVQAVAPVQQACPSPPHALHVPAVLDAVSRPEQTNPVSHVPLLPEPQHAWAEPPHVVQMLPEDFSTQDPEVHCVAPPPVQQACPSPPHALQVPGVPADAVRPEQAKPVLQVPLLPVPQHDCPDPPQVAHTLPLADNMQDIPLSHDPPPAPPGQQDWPEAPHALHVPPPPSPSVKHPRPL